MTWTIIISAVTGPEGLKISIAKEYARNISDEDVTGDFIGNHHNHLLRPKAMLERAFPERISLENEVRALKSFEGVSFFSATKWNSLSPASLGQ